MKSEHDEQILDGALSEVLGGLYPPDLTSKILQTWDARKGQLAEVSMAAPPVQSSLEPPAPPVQPAAVVRAGSPVRQTRRKPREAAWWMAAACIFMAVVGGSLYLATIQPSDIDRLLTQQPLPTSETSRGTEIASDHTSATNVAKRPKVSPRPRAGRFELPPEIDREEANESPLLAQRVVEAESTSAVPAPLVVEPSSDEEIIAFVNATVRESWQSHSVTPSPPAADSEWCRRVYTLLVGREPSADEMQGFLRDADPQRRRSLVDDLLASDLYASQWSDVWTNVLVGDASSSSKHTSYDREGLQEHLYQRLKDDVPYNQVAFELLVASGTNRRNADDYNAAVNFSLAVADRDALTATDRTARVFLGKQIVCTRCHHHPANDWEQRDFWALNAFFRQMQISETPEADGFYVRDQDFFGESGSGKDAEIFFRQPGGHLRIAYPEFAGQELTHSGMLSDVVRRRELAKLVVGSTDFRQAVVNRVWEKLMGYGFTQPVDDMGPHNPPSHPKLVERLGEQFAAHDFNLDGLVRWVLLSEPFGLSDKRMPESWLDAPEKGGHPLFARRYKRSAVPSDIHRSLMLAVNRPRERVAGSVGTLARRAWIEPPRTQLQIVETSVAQELPGTGWLTQLGASRISAELKIDHVFRSVLSRKPTSRELTAAKLVLADRLDDTVGLFEVWRTLLSTEE